METLKNQLVEQQQNNPYNEEPVFYCKHCLSLRIRDIAGLPDSDYCDSCGTTEIGTTTIAEWQEMYKAKYGYYYLENY